ncbi:biotin transport system substrate-specific component [Silvibacterium bohemicum]|uniref:Biotin transporter n=1 Tax=Silvibacterium bohemicum TaxID=1577686 RepID=A0A841K654_9BACT|nr:biotin transporter BioY [Silvibacterium bohemicum]MBB6146621.1 biotin transport system substrate-specific component [Silvibacterium bohemicum]
MAEIQTAGTVSAVCSPLQPTLASHLSRQTALVIGASAFVAVCAHLSVPLLFTPVPLTMQNFAVLVVGMFLAPAPAFAALALYLIEGASGLPVFTPHGGAGLLHLLGPSGGFLLAYPFVAAGASMLSRRIRPASFTTYAFSAAAASVFLYLCGAAWFTVLSHLSLAATLKMTVLPFLPGDALKVITAAGIVSATTKFRRRIGA